MNENQAWAKQSASLVEVQKFGSNLEKTVRGMLGWKFGKVTYDSNHGYQIQVDAAWPTLKSPEFIASVTYTKPDKPGHSNENKLQLKIGELALLKHAFPNMKAVLLIGGTKEAWLPYVLEAFKYFFDETIYLWEGDSSLKRIETIKSNPQSLSCNNIQLWKDLSSVTVQAASAMSRSMGNSDGAS
jgi:hypothetical protein